MKYLKDIITRQKPELLLFGLLVTLGFTAAA